MTAAHADSASQQALRGCRTAGRTGTGKMLSRARTTIVLADPEKSDGDLPPGWVSVTVGSVGTVRVGRQRSPDKHTGRFATKYLRAANITSEGLDLSDVLEMDFEPREREVFKLKPGDIVLAEASGSASQVGRAALWAGEIPECCYQNTVIRFRSSVVLPDYALVVFRHYAESGEFARVARGIGIQHLGSARFAEMPFPLPPKAEQIRITEEVQRRFAEAREAETSLQSALRHIGKQNREILAAAALGELVEPDAKTPSASEASQDELSAFEPSGKQTKVQLGLFDKDKLANSESRQPLPDGWLWKTVGEIGELKLGRQRSPKHERGDHPTPYLRVANVHEDDIDFDDLTLMNFTPEEQEVYRLQRGDILLNSGQSPELVGRPAIIRQEIPLVCFQNHLIRFRPKDFLNGEYALLVFRHYLHSGVFQSVARWSTNLANLSLSSLAALPFPLPPIREQSRIVTEARRRLDASRAQKRAVRTSIDRISMLRSEVLAAAVSGALVPQSEEDEPAASLLSQNIETVEEPQTQRKKRAPQVKEKRMHPDTKRPLREVLLTAGRPLQVSELFALAGYDRDSTEDVERFYLSLREELGRSVYTVGGDGEHALLEASTDAT